jgi:hypothetical protein
VACKNEYNSNRQLKNSRETSIQTITGSKATIGVGVFKVSAMLSTGSVSASSTVTGNGLDCYITNEIKQVIINMAQLTELQ